MNYRESNGEKKILWWIVKAAVWAFGVVATIATAINAWAVKDYIEFKQISALRWEREAKNDTRRDIWLKWQSEVLVALAKQHGIVIPPEPPIPLDPDDNAVAKVTK